MCIGQDRQFHDLFMLPHGIQIRKGYRDTVAVNPRSWLELLRRNGYVEDNAYIRQRQREIRAFNRFRPLVKHLGLNLGKRFYCPIFEFHFDLVPNAGPYPDDGGITDFPDDEPSGLFARPKREKEGNGCRESTEPSGWCIRVKPV